jgi:hypothetical protein
VDQLGGKLYRDDEMGQAKLPTCRRTCMILPKQHRTAAKRVSSFAVRIKALELVFGQGTHIISSHCDRRTLV